MIKINEEDYLSGSALYEIAKLRIKQRDFYEAYFNLQRACHIKFKSRKLNNYKSFTEGVWREWRACRSFS